MNRIILPAAAIWISVHSCFAVEMGYLYQEMITDAELLLLNNGFSEDQAKNIKIISILTYQSFMCGKSASGFSSKDIGQMIISIAKDTDVPPALFMNETTKIATQINEYLEKNNSEWLKFCATKKQ